MSVANPLSFINVSVFGIPNTLLVAQTPFHLILDNDIEQAFLNPKEFAFPAIYTHVTGETKTYNVIMDDPNDSVSLFDGNVMDIDMFITCHQARFIRLPVHGDLVTLKGILYNVIKWEPDGVGILRLSLKREGNEQAHTN